MKILNVRYDNVTRDEAVERAVSLAKLGRKKCIFFLNIDCLSNAPDDKEYRDILNSADMVLPDGIGLELAIMLFGGRMLGNCNGTDFLPLFIKSASEKGYEIFFLGGRNGSGIHAPENFGYTF